MINRKTLILGGVRSGKSRQAEGLASESRLPISYIATAAAKDKEMYARIAAHRSRRPAHWQLIEEPVHLASVLKEHAGSGQCLIVDCLTLWLTNLLTSDDLGVLETELTKLFEVLPTLSGQIFLVSNETNMGVIPMGELSRQFCDQAGRMHQELAHLSDCVVLMVAGLPHVLKGELV